MKDIIKLPKFFRPNYSTELIRIGLKNDGSYLIPKKSLELTKKLFSFGMELDWSFEEDFYNRTKCKIYCYDHTVDWKLFVKRSIKSPNTLLKFVQYKKFFDYKNKFHIKKQVFPSDTFNLSKKNVSYIDPNQIFIDEIGKLSFLKIDIEGDEYRILDQIVKYSDKINTLIIEFHHVDLHIEKIKEFIDKIDLNLVHLHVNNFSNLNQFDLPQTLELIFCHKEFSKINKNENINYPLSIDQPNNPEFKDLPIYFEN